MVCKLDGSNFKKTQKAHLHPLRVVCVQYEINPPLGFQDLLRKQNVARNQACLLKINPSKAEFNVKIHDHW